MRSLFFLILAIGLASGFYSSKCKDAEVSSDKLLRIMDNVNCTLLEGRRKLRKSFNNFHEKFKIGIQSVKSWLREEKVVPKKEDFDHPIDVRTGIEAGDDAHITKRAAEDEVTEEETQKVEGENPEETTIAIGSQFLFFAPNKCRANQKFVNGRCRYIYD